MSNFDDDEFEKSIASIVDETTADAEAYVSENDNIQKKEPIRKPNKKHEDAETVGEKVRKIIIIVAIVLALFAIIGVSTYFAVKTAINKSKDNYSYYHSLGYESYEEKDYESAIVNFEKALTYDEGKSDSKNNINMMLYLFEAYNKTGKTDKAEQILKKIITINPSNENAYYNLVALYEKQGDYSKIKTLYESLSETEKPAIVSMFNKYLAASATVNIKGGTFKEDLTIELSCDDPDCQIYFALGQSDPSSNPTVYTEPIKLTLGSTTIRFYTRNQYGFESAIVTESYSIDYEGPTAPRFEPADLSISSTEVVNVFIKNVKEDCEVFYTIDGSTPTQASKKYDPDNPIELPAGTTIVSALVVDSHGLTSIGTHTYTVTYVYEPEYTETEAKDAIWERLIARGVVDEEHFETTEGLLCQLDIKKRELINGRNIYVFYFSTNGFNYDFFYGADADNLTVYRLKANGSSYSIIETL